MTKRVRPFTKRRTYVIRVSIYISSIFSVAKKARDLFLILI